MPILCAFHLEGSRYLGQALGGLAGRLPSLILVVTLLVSFCSFSFQLSPNIRFQTQLRLLNYSKVCVRLRKILAKIPQNITLKIVYFARNGGQKFPDDTCGTKITF